MLRLSNVSKFYYHKGVIATGFTKVNLEFNIGEFVAITGESGSGKSTLLNVISGLDTYEEGEMYINGEETSHYTEKDFENFRRKYISNIFQTFNLVNSYTVYQNIELVLLLNGYKKRKIKQKVLDLIKKVDLYKFRNTKVSKLSGGQKQRVAIARALAKETPIIIADEPTGNLDTESAKSIIQLLSEISKDKLVIIVTHNYEQVEEYVTRKIKMHDGRILEDKQIRKIDSPNIEVNEGKYKNLTFFNKIRLGVRNTFNIFIKFALLFCVFLFITVAVISEYASFKEQEHLAEIGGYAPFFSNTDEQRIIIKKQDKTAFSEEDYKEIENLENVSSIVKTDLLLDFQVSLINNNIFLNGTVDNINNFEGTVDIGRMPENDYEIVAVGNKDSYFLGERVDELLETELYLMDNYTGETESKLKLVGIKYRENDYYYNDAVIYFSDIIQQKLQFQVNQQYSKMKVLFLDTYYDSTIYNPYFKIVPNSNVPAGKTYVSRDLNSMCSNGSSIGKNIKIEVENIYYNDEITLKIDRTYTKNNIKSLLGITNYDSYKGSIFINPDDYNYLFNKASYQSTVMIENVEKLPETKAQLQELGLTTLAMKESLTNSGEAKILQMFRTIVTIALVITLFFISYFIIKIILKSRNSYYAILRMLGANKKIAKQLLIIELFCVANLAYWGFMLILMLTDKGMLQWSLCQTILEYLKIQDYACIYIVLIVMSYFISLKYAKKLFKDSTIKTYNEEV